MNRRSFLHTASSAAAGFAAATGTRHTVRSSPPQDSARGSFSLDGNRVRFFSDAITSPLKVMVVGDTHLFRDDERGNPYSTYSARMAAAYNETRHVETGAATSPEACISESLLRAVDEDVDLLALIGDIFSFPSEAAVEWLNARLEDAALPYLYVAGNHDWHYEGMPGTLESLRSTWTESRLKSLYRGRNPLMAAYNVKGVQFLTIDNSTYQILPEQLTFFREQVESGQPLVLFMHIPLYAPGRSIGFGCGHPDWGAAADRNYSLEKRPRWPEAGHTPVTMDFHRAVFAAENLLGVFAGHIHRPSLDVVGGLPQFVTGANAEGALMMADFLPRNV